MLLLSIAVIIGIVLALGSKYLAVEVDTRVEDVFKMLPGLNCGACGSAGCRQFAEKLVNGEADVGGCRPSTAQAKEAIAAYLKSKTQ